MPNEGVATGAIVNEDHVVSDETRSLLGELFLFHLEEGAAHFDDLLLPQHPDMRISIAFLKGVRSVACEASNKKQSRYEAHLRSLRMFY
ncbi:hypothetical protein PY650_32200 [Rhizobium calliandrae]|uniref:Uncharacterized protein n=1 Tax=Rhizobium calliandrae TaxID=1312182 RepID=A0ABT7KQH1_9HYPH|nr:hypothetical protein [Rhizobium calliandrae]MDL2410193.1 hypothetical protein [Rhizobium calliandrae]